MPSINMIAARRAEKRKQERNTQKLVYGILAEFGIFLVLTSVMVMRIVATHNQIADLDDQVRSLQPKVNEIDELQAETAALQPKVNALTQAKTGTLYWYTALNDVSSSMGGDAWLTDVNALGSPTGTDPGSQAKFNVNGAARTQFAVGATMLRMNAFPTVDQVLLNNVTQSNDPIHQKVTFQLIVQLKPESAPATAGGQNAQKS